jgi:transcriptional regulator with XRE-family HTH domain
MDRYGGMSRRVGSNVRQLRKVRGLTLQDLIDTLVTLGAGDMSVAALSRLETGRRTITVDQMTTLAEALDVAPSDLLEAELPPSALTGQAALLAETPDAGREVEVERPAYVEEEMTVGAMAFERLVLDMARHHPGVSWPGRDGVPVEPSVPAMPAMAVRDALDAVALAALQPGIEAAMHVLHDSLARTMGRLQSSPPQRRPEAPARWRDRTPA